MAIVFETQEEFERAVMEVVVRRAALTTSTSTVWTKDAYGNHPQRVVQDVEVFIQDSEGEVG